MGTKFLTGMVIGTIVGMMVSPKLDPCTKDKIKKVNKMMGDIGEDVCQSMRNTSGSDNTSGACNTGQTC